MHNLPTLTSGISSTSIVVRNRALVLASVAASGPRKLLQNILRWKQFKVPSSTTTSGKRAASRSGSKLSPAHQASNTDFNGRPGAGGARNVGIVWFRSDLRLHDNEALTRAHSECSSLLPVYCFDPREYGRSALGYDRTGPYRASFLIEAVADLRARLQAAGSELLVRIGRPEEVLTEMVRKVGATAVYCHSEVTAEACTVEQQVASAVESSGAKLKTFWCNTLHHVEDLPFKLTDLPQHFDKYKANVSRIVPRAALGELKEVRGMPLGGKMEAGELPTLKDLGLAPLSTSASNNRNKENNCRGGESEALKQLDEFLQLASARQGSVKGRATYANSFSNKVAPWLATGCLSPRRMLEDVKSVLGVDVQHIPAATASSGSAQAQGGSTGASQGSGLQWVEFELLWRDFFRLLTKKSSQLQKMGAGAVGVAQKQTYVAPAMAMA